jgi:DNA-directed RNA polymerase specialized sigma24 family protein
MYYSSYGPSEEERLVARCLQGEHTAWETLFRDYHPQLVSIIKSLTPHESGAEQAEEVAAAVWSSLCGGAFSRLRRYDPRTGRLLGYLARMARSEIWRERRSERRRYTRECKAARKEATWDEVGRELILQEFLTTLSHREREFCLSYLMQQANSPVRPKVSAANGWRLRSRVLKKFRTFYLLPAGDEQVEQDRAPDVLPYHGELAGAAPGESCGRRELDREHANANGVAGRSGAGYELL